MVVERVVVGLLLDDGAREVARVVAGVVLVVLLALLLAVATPIALLAGSSGLPAATPRPPTHVNPTPAHPSGPDRATVVDIARQYLGVPYVFGGSNPATGLDCSGLVQLVFHQLGVGLPRTAQRQYAATARVAEDQLQPGDLVFFARTYADPRDWITHVGIYIGGGLQINAPTEGQVVSIQPVFSGYWGAHYAGGGQLPGG